MTSDLDLLGQFARDNSQDAFAEIVRRHLGLVHSAALRQVRSPQLAEDVSQSVFSDLARDAGRLKPDTVLTAWLYAVTRRTAIDVIRKESRRRLREQIAAEMTNMNATANDWTQIEPLLDDAMAALDETDRSAVLLRYFENKSLREVGQALGASEDAAQKRVSRAVERLREFFSKRGVAIGASGLVLVMSANAVQAAPVGLAVAISTAALTGIAISTSTVVAATKTIAMTALQKTIVGATLAAVAGTGIYEARQASQLREQNQTLRQQQAPLIGQIQQLQHERDDVTNRLTLLADEMDKSKTNADELLRLRGEVARWRREAEDVAADAKEAKDFQAGMMQMLSNTPLIRTFVSTTMATVPWSQAIVTGGWKTPDGKRVIVLSTPHQGADTKTLTIKSCILEYTDDAGTAIGLGQFNNEEDTSKAHVLSADQFEAILNAAKNYPGVTIMAGPATTMLDGHQAEIFVTEDHYTPSGQKYSTGPGLNFVPTISPDGQSVQMVMTAQLNYPIPIPRH